MRDYSSLDLNLNGNGRGNLREFYADEQAAGRLPRVALSIKQPWAWLIVNGYKDIENRSWRRQYPDRVLVHAGKAIDVDASDDLLAGRHPVTNAPLPPEMRQAYYEWFTSEAPKYGGFVGFTDITDCVEQSASEWFVGRYGFTVANAKPLPFLPWRGLLGFFPVEIPS